MSILTQILNQVQDDRLLFRGLIGNYQSHSKAVLFKPPLSYFVNNQSNNTTLLHRRWY
jgi:hypothetical protein